jgi:hypothetical protein
MNKPLALIVAASVLGILTMTLLFTTTQRLGSTSQTTDQVAENTQCQVQVREAKRASDPQMVEDKCIEYIDDSSFKTEAENAQVLPIIS